MKIAAAYALAETVSNPTVDMILPSALEKGIALRIASKVAAAA